MDTEEIVGDCVEANASTFHFYLAHGRYPNKAKIPPNICPEKMIGSKDHQLVAFQQNIKTALEWRLVQGTILYLADKLPMVHSWCEATLEDIGGLWRTHHSQNGRFVFDFSSREFSPLFFQSVEQFNALGSIPLDDHPELWKGYEHLYHRNEYNFEEAAEVINKSFGTWKFYEIDTGPINALRSYGGS